VKGEVDEKKPEWIMRVQGARSINCYSVLGHCSDGLSIGWCVSGARSAEDIAQCI
jgi:hypothetical protein